MYRRSIAILAFGLIFMVTGALYLENRMGPMPVLTWGSKGFHVEQIQEGLAAQGFYRGDIHGTLDGATWRSVREFQAKHRIRVSGIVDGDTWRALGFGNAYDSAVPTQAGRVVARDDVVHLLARVIMAEAGAEPYVGKVAVGGVILNRVRDAQFPNTVSGVIYQPLAFESVSRGTIWRPVSQDAYRAARQCLAGWDPSGGALFFWNPGKPVNPWIWTRRIQTRIGQHVFAR
ncbi:MAG: cell wall hydrolase [Eubacteriales bacterium]|nr:cell wall hydrolase [Eubacteriales bacterium]MDQ7790201.1 cell wall hydrolase [Clostridia bacterium]MDZ4043910.1 cell wall hydrolase [Eubacteriales bacterium]MDZ7609952.1 cell wall hydrolase [Eubacteriales bacterium]